MALQPLTTQSYERTVFYDYVANNKVTIPARLVLYKVFTLIVKGSKSCTARIRYIRFKLRVNPVACTSFPADFMIGKKFWAFFATILQRNYMTSAPKISPLPFFLRETKYLIFMWHGFKLNEQILTSVFL